MNWVSVLGGTVLLLLIIAATHVLPLRNRWKRWHPLMFLSWAGSLSIGWVMRFDVATWMLAPLVGLAVYVGYRVWQCSRQRVFLTHI